MTYEDDVDWDAPCERQAGAELTCVSHRGYFPRSQETCEARRDHDGEG